MKSKILIFVLVPLIALMVISAFLLETRVKNALVSLSEKMALELTISKSKEVNNWFQGLVKEVKVIASWNMVKDALKTGEWKSLIERDLKEIAKYMSEFEMLFIAYPDGNSISTLGAVSNISDRSYFKERMEKGNLKDIYQDVFRLRRVLDDIDKKFNERKEYMLEFR
ncbi:MAG: hypothetical protein QXZ06_01480 [Candidatus Jordarchaeales archaeon]